MRYLKCVETLHRLVLTQMQLKKNGFWLGRKKIVTLEDKQDFANVGVWYLCQFVGGMKDGSMPQFIQDFPARAQLEFPTPQFTDGNSLKGLQYIADTIQSGIVDKTNVKAIYCLCLQINSKGAFKLERGMTSCPSSRYLAFWDPLH